MNAFSKVLVANRGEIACRIIRAARDLGYGTVAVYSDADADAPHVRAADEAVPIGPPEATQSYQSIERLLEAAARTGADALHPGYGFLAENEALARACQDAGLTFVGPPPRAIALMGDKVQAKRRMVEAGVPTAPAYLGDEQDHATLLEQATKIGFPLLVKAVAGGGGRGMRIVREPAELDAALDSARSEAEAAFGRADVFLERFVERARHVEIQVFCDTRGHALHLGERECSVQRRHQKIIEEAPSPAVDADLRSRMGQAAVAAARAIDYVGAGTVEFLLTDDGRFYFLEMNTRLQVEHPVTELVTGLDLVAWQLEVAAGAALPITEQDRVPLIGHAIEARLCAEDPTASFLPQAGTVHAFVPPEGQGIRVDAGIRPGQRITSFYDSMIAKIIAYGPDRETARRRLVQALRRTVVVGPTTNRAFLIDVLQRPTFVNADIRIDDLDGQTVGDREIPSEAWAVAGVLCSHPAVGDASTTFGWRPTSADAWPITLRSRVATKTMRVSQPEPRTYAVDLGERTQEVHVLGIGAQTIDVLVGGIRRRADWTFADGTLFLRWEDLDLAFREPEARRSSSTTEADGAIRAPLAGRIKAVLVEVGRKVDAGDTLVVVEAMKMDHRVVAVVGGRVCSLRVAVGDQVTGGQVLAEVEAAPQGDSKEDER